MTIPHCEVCGRVVHPGPCLRAHVDEALTRAREDAAEYRRALVDIAETADHGQALAIANAVLAPIEAVGP